MQHQRCRFAGSMLNNPRAAATDNARPSAAPTSDSSALSTSNCRISVFRPAPIARRTAISFCRATARDQQLATFEYAITRTRPAMHINTMSAVEYCRRRPEWPLAAISTSAERFRNMSRSRDEIMRSAGSPASCPQDLMEQWLQRGAGRFDCISRLQASEHLYPFGCGGFPVRRGRESSPAPSGSKHGYPASGQVQSREASGGHAYDFHWIVIDQDLFAHDFRIARETAQPILVA
jgi:hypothetical protein